MESFLNILWVLIALCALWVWRVHWVRQERAERRNPVQEWTAFLCGLVLLFFAVSLTDDLHSEIVLFDECASGRRHSAVCSCAHPAPHGAKAPSASGPAIVPAVSAIQQFRVIARISAIRQDLMSRVSYSFSSGRAPPISNL
jgi:hypothetical protein